MRSTYFNVLLILTMVLASCSDDSNPVGSSSQMKEIMPLSVGNWWVYKVTEYVNHTITFVGYDTLSVNDTYVDTDSTVWYVATNITATGAISMFWRNESEGLVMKYGNDYEVVCKYPANREEVYSRGSFRVDIKVASTDTLISTPLGLFFCYEYLYNPERTDRRDSDFFCPGIGWVMHYTSRLGYPFYIKELIAYNVK